ncbi:MAG: MotA/TolQ/ExbB proton channel family protein [Nitrospinota bacterium]
MEATPLYAKHSGSIIDMVMQSGPAAKAVFLILLFFSMVSWAIMIFKFFGYNKIRRETNEFLRIFSKSKSLQSIQNQSKGMRSCPMVRVFYAGYSELESEFHISVSSMDEEEQRYLLKKIDGIARAMDRTISQEVTILERFLFFLATTGSTAPFIGLFGTVWGIMKSFQSVGLAGSSNIAIVAPGIAEALIATAAGLATAVPAVIGYNYLINRVKVFGTEMENFGLDFLSLIEKNYVKR